MIKKLLISPYFGKLPNYFQLFLNSCKMNDDFTDFLIITDDNSHFEVPSNVKILLMTFEDFIKLTKQKLGASYGISSPYKICDYRPAFGKIFEDFTEGYDFWGHVDMDLILGKLSNFLPHEAFLKNERLLERGALMFYKNSDPINTLYQKSMPGIINFKEATMAKDPCFYDEIMFPALFKSSGYSTYSNTNYADILPQYFRFTIDSHCAVGNVNDQLFRYQDGIGLYRDSAQDGTPVECMYIHLQKRPMDVDINFDKAAEPVKLYIQENSISDRRRETSSSIFKRIGWRIRYTRMQWKKLDMAHIKIHLKTRTVRRNIEW